MVRFPPARRRGRSHRHTHDTRSLKCAESPCGSWRLPQPSAPPPSTHCNRPPYPMSLTVLTSSVAHVGLALACGPVGYLLGLAILVPLVDRFPPKIRPRRAVRRVGGGLGGQCRRRLAVDPGAHRRVIGACSTVGAQLSSATARFVPDGRRATRAGNGDSGHFRRDHRRPDRRWLADGRGGMAGRLARVRPRLRHRRARLTTGPARHTRIGHQRLSGDTPRSARPVPAIPDVAHRSAPRRALVLRVLRGVGRPRRRAGTAAVLVLSRADRPVRPRRSPWHRRHPHRRGDGPTAWAHDES